MHHTITAVSGSKETTMLKRLRLDCRRYERPTVIQYSRRNCELLSRHVLYGRDDEAGSREREREITEKSRVLRARDRLGDQGISLFRLCQIFPSFFFNEQPGKLTEKAEKIGKVAGVSPTFTRREGRPDGKFQVDVFTSAFLDGAISRLCWKIGILIPFPSAKYRDIALNCFRNDEET